MTTQPLAGTLDFGPGDRLRLARRRLLPGTPQAELAHLLRVSPQALAAWESGRNEAGITPAVAKRLEVLTRVPGLAAWILGVHPRGGGGLLLRLDSNQEPPGLRYGPRTGFTGNRDVVVTRRSPVAEQPSAA